MTEKQRDFNKDARSWDDNQRRVNMVRDIGAAIRVNTVIDDTVDVLDFGCGTGLLTLQFQPYVKTVTGADSSQGMLDILASKIENLSLPNIRIIYIENGSTDRLKQEYDLIVSSMTLHHVKDTAALLSKFYEITRSGGHICIADLDPDRGLFHEDNTGVFHYGFDREKLEAEFRKAGFTDIKAVTAAEVTRPAPDGGVRKFTLFLMCGGKR